MEGGRGTFQERSPFPPPNLPLSPPKIFVWVNGVRGGVAACFGGVRLPVVRQKKGEGGERRAGERKAGRERKKAGEEKKRGKKKANKKRQGRIKARKKAVKELLRLFVFFREDFKGKF